MNLGLTLQNNNNNIIFFWSVSFIKTFINSEKVSCMKFGKKAYYSEFISRNSEKKSSLFWDKISKIN